MFDEIKLSMLKSKMEAAYKASIRAQKEYTDMLRLCPHNHITTLPIMQSTSGQREFECECCHRRIWQNDNGTFTTMELVAPQVITLDGKRIVGEIK